MTQHPPWLRFQAYLVGLPKTGSTSVATVFGGYRTGHEWALLLLAEAGLARRRGQLTDAAFLDVTRGRLVPPSLEMDSATVHHLYADLLRDTFPTAVFVHTVRDVRSWVTSMLDMMLRKRIARRRVDLPFSEWELDYLASATEGTYDADPGATGDDSASVAPLMRYWAQHMRQMRADLPADRTLTLRTADIGRRLDDMAALTGVPVGTLRADLAHTNRAPVSLDRFAAFDTAGLRAAYEEHCAALMAQLFPDEHRRVVAGQDPPDPLVSWADHVAAVDRWVVDAIATYGPTVAR